MSINPDSQIRADDFIDESEQDATRANDNGRVPKLETVGGDGGRIAKSFIPDAVVKQNKKILVEDTDVIVSNTTTETNIFSTSIGADVMGTTNAIRIKIYVTDLGIEESLAPESQLTLRLKYGATTLASVVVTSETTQLSGAKGVIEAFLLEAGTTASQDGFISLLASNNATNFDASPSQVFTVGNGTATEDSTGALNLIVSAQWNQADNNNDFTAGMHVVELISA